MDCIPENDTEMDKFVNNALKIEPSLKGFSRTLRTFYTRKKILSPDTEPDVLDGITYGMKQKSMWKKIDTQSHEE